MLKLLKSIKNIEPIKKENIDIIHNINFIPCEYKNCTCNCGTTVLNPSSGKVEHISHSIYTHHFSEILMYLEMEKYIDRNKSLEERKLLVRQLAEEFLPSYIWTTKMWENNGNKMKHHFKHR